VDESQDLTGELGAGFARNPWSDSELRTKSDRKIMDRKMNRRWAQKCEVFVAEFPFACIPAISPNQICRAHRNKGTDIEFIAVICPDK
jgi:hypothetical protein